MKNFDGGIAKCIDHLDEKFLATRPTYDPMTRIKSIQMDFLIWEWSIRHQHLIQHPMVFADRMSQ